MTGATFVAEVDPEIVRLRVAEKLGWQAFEYSRHSCLVGHAPGKKGITAVPSYARDIKSAWEIVNYLADKNIQVTIVNETLRGRIRHYIVHIGQQMQVLAAASNQSPSLALCMAFLQIDSLAC